jgi:hypothetical protein
MVHEHKERVEALSKKQYNFIGRTSGILIHPGGSTTLTKRSDPFVIGSSGELGMRWNTRRISFPIYYL